MTKAERRARKRWDREHRPKDKYVKVKGGHKGPAAGGAGLAPAQVYSVPAKSLVSGNAIWGRGRSNL